MRIRTRPDTILLADADELAPLARRTNVLRAAAAAALLAIGVAAIVLGRDPHVRELQLLPNGSSGIVVLDLSASISTDTYSRIGATLTDLAATRGRYGLVIFSDTAYEALPPGTPSEALRPFIRFFTLPPQRRPGVAPSFPTNPWTSAFSAGTRISTGLDAARSLIIDHHLKRPAVLLISDLDNDPGDLPKVTSLALAYQREGIPLHIVGLNSSLEDERLFRRLAGDAGSFRSGRLPGERAAGSSAADFPFWLAAAALGLALLLAANELWCARLSWAPRPSPEGGPS